MCGLPDDRPGYSRFGPAARGEIFFFPVPPPLLLVNGEDPCPQCYKLVTWHVWFLFLFKKKNSWGVFNFSFFSSHIFSFYITGIGNQKKKNHVWHRTGQRRKDMFLLEQERRMQARRRLPLSAPQNRHHRGPAKVVDQLQRQGYVPCSAENSPIRIIIVIKIFFFSAPEADENIR